MNASLFIIGTELTEGIIGDRHCQFLSKALADIGYRIDRMVIVPDDGTVGKVLRDCLESSDLVLVTGGLGPTSDDMTRSLIAEIAGVPLVQNMDVYRWLYDKMGDRIHGSNEVQTFIPQGFDYIPNERGTACGFSGMIGHTRIYAMPGPPFELEGMFRDHVYPMIMKELGIEPRMRSEYTTFLIPEAQLENAMKQIHCPIGWGTRFQDFRISLYLDGNDEDVKKQVIGQLDDMIGRYRIFEGSTTAERCLSDYLLEHGLTVSCAESCTSGLCAKLLTDRAGSSAYFVGGADSYANEAKIKLLGVRAETIEKYSPVSRECAIEMAEGIRDRLDTDMAFSVTGIAGPAGGTEENPVGTVWFGFSSRDGRSEAVKLHLSAHSRDIVRRRAAVAALIMSRIFLENDSLLDIVQKWQYI